MLSVSAWAVMVTKLSSTPRFFVTTQSSSRDRLLQPRPHRWTVCHSLPTLLRVLRRPGPCAPLVHGATANYQDVTMLLLAPGSPSLLVARLGMSDLLRSARSRSAFSGPPCCILTSVSRFPPSLSICAFDSENNPFSHIATHVPCF